MGGSPPYADSVRAIKNYRRQATTSQKWPSQVDDDHHITFSAIDTRGLHTPHNDPLPIDIGIGECEVTKVLVDTGSSVDLIFRDTLDKMGIDLRDMKPSSRTLTGFNGASEQMIGRIRLPVYAGDVTRTVKFSIIRTKAPYNAVLGTPWFHSMQAIPSTYNQCIKFLGKNGTTQKVRGDQKAARELLIATVKLQQPTSLVNSVAKLTRKIHPQEEEILEVSLDGYDPSKVVRIGAFLSDEMHSKIVSFLKTNASNFAWETSDMKGIDPAVTSHELNVDPTLLDAGFLTGVRYPKWLANPVIVKKKNGKWRICIDFTDLNKACPKDSYPLPHIDRLVESTDGNELLAFMDAFSGYNQIQMHPDDREKTAFITDRGTYCYKVMPFSLKNAGATYHRLVNWMFADKLGDTMEVYIDDMLVKSLHAGNHLNHLRDCYKTLNEYRMKFNPTICTFGVSSGKSSLSEVGDTLSLYIAVTSSTVSDVLIQEDRGEQKLIFYINKRMTEPETRYTTFEKMALAVVTSARKIQPYFQSHMIEILSNQPLRTVMQNTNQSGRLTKWVMELSEHNIIYKNRTAAKSQVLVDFLIELTPELEQDLVLPSKNWIPHVDGSSTNKGLGAGVQLQSPTGELIRQSFNFGFAGLNNKAEYESLIAGICLVKAVKAKRVSAYCNSQLIVIQYLGDYDVRNERMDAYLKLVQELTRDFEFFELTKVPRGENICVDAPYALRSKLHDQVKRTIPIHKIEKPSINTTTEQMAITASVTDVMQIDEQDPHATENKDQDWRKEFIDYVADNKLPPPPRDGPHGDSTSWRENFIDGALQKYCSNASPVTRQDSSSPKRTKAPEAITQVGEPSH
ncbi:hypothetical protein N665_0339s0054 [Sinapis alba]|nr:hypothetical protein N665_0339s0054 [Sinapis alba]